MEYLYGHNSSWICMRDRLTLPLWTCCLQVALPWSWGWTQVIETCLQHLIKTELLFSWSKNASVLLVLEPVGCNKKIGCSLTPTIRKSALSCTVASSLREEVASRHKVGQCCPVCFLVFVATDTHRSRTPHPHPQTSVLAAAICVTSCLAEVILGNDHRSRA